MSDPIETLFRSEGRRIYTLLLRLTGNPEEAEDLTQEVFLKAARSFDSFRGQSQASTWLFRIAVNAARDRWRRRRLEPESFEEALAAGRAQEPATTAGFTERGVDRQEAREMVESGLARLEPPMREILLLRESEGLSYEELAAVLDLPLGTVQSRLARARATLRDWIRRNFPDWEP